MSLDKNFDIDQTITPYEDGDHCMFFAIQEANIYFNKQGLPRTELLKFDNAKIRMESLYESISGNDEFPGIAMSIRYLNSKLNEHGIVFSKIYCAESMKDKMIDFLGKSVKAPINTLKEGASLTFKCPAILISQTADGDAHTWCITSKKKFEQDKDKHLNQADGVFFVASLKRG